MTRISRNLETREMETRVNDQRPHYEMNYNSPLSLPDGLIRKGYVGKWINYEIKGERTYGIQEFDMKGANLVPRERYANFAKDPLEQDPRLQQYIGYKDVLLMEMPEHIDKKIEENLNNLNAKTIRSIPGLNGRNSLINKN